MEFHGIEMYGQLILEMSALPSWSAADEGRIIYDTTNDIMYIGGSAAWLKMADDAVLQAHIGYTGTAVHGLGTMSTQNANNVGITGGTIKLTSGTTISEFSIDGTLSGDSDDAAPTEKAVKEYVDSFAQGLDWQESVLSMIAIGSAVQTLGNRYISTATGGGWTTNNIYESSGAGWIEIVPTEGFASWVEDENVLYVYNGSAWVKFGATTTHGNLLGLSADDHTQYAYLNGRSGGQILYGGTAAGDDLQLKSTSNGTKGSINIGENSVYDDVNHRLGINEPSPSATLDINGDLLLQTGTSVNNISTGTGLGSSDDIICTQLAIKTYVDGRTTGDSETSHYHDSRYFTETESDARFLLEANNLSDLDDAGTARTNLGLTGDSNTTHYHDGRYFTETESDARYLLEANNLNDLTDASAARTNLGLTGDSNTTHYHDGRYFTETESDARFLLEANNLSDLDNLVTARSNLGLGTISLLDSINNDNWLGTDLAIINGGTGASTASGALVNLGISGDKIFEGNTSVECIDAGTGTIVFTTDGTQRVLIDDDGYVGIGSGLTPTYPLHVSTTNDIIVKFASTDNSSSIMISDDDTDSYIGSEGGSTFISNTGATLADGQLIIDNTGKVTLSSGTGINEFSIDGTLAGNSDDAVPTEKAVKTYVAAEIASGGGGASDKIFEGDTSVECIDTGTGRIEFTTDGTEAMRIDENGNVGIGLPPIETTGSDYTALQIGGNASIIANTEIGPSDEVQLILAENAYLDNITWKQISSGPSTIYSQYNGVHQFFGAPSGAADSNSNITSNLIIDNEGGGLTIPNMPSFHAYCSTNTYFISGGNYTVLPWSDNIDIGSNFSGSYFTAPFDGIYHFSTTVRISLGQVAAGYYGVYMTLGNRIIRGYADFSQMNAGLIDPHNISLSATGDMDGGDTAFVSVMQYGGTVPQAYVPEGSSSVFSGHLVNKIAV